jgi:hypothetical protein
MLIARAGAVAGVSRALHGVAHARWQGSQPVQRAANAVPRATRYAHTSHEYQKPV